MTIVIYSGQYLQIADRCDRWWHMTNFVRLSRYASSGAIALVILVIASFLTRLLPLAFSPYPFNNDGITECVVASEIINTGHVVVLPSAYGGTTHSEATPIFNIFIAFCASCLGTDPFLSSQMFNALISVVTVAGVFMLARRFVDDIRGAVTGAFLALLLGTFVFTTASVWKEALGIALMLLALLTFLQRSEPRFRALCFLILMVLPLTHHLVAGITFLMLAFPLAWSWYLAITNNVLRLRHLHDVVTVVVPGVWTFFYYSTVALDRFQGFIAPISIALIATAFVLICEILFLVLRMKTHSKRSFAILPGAALAILVFLDYKGYLFDYEPSAQSWYLVLAFSFAGLISVAWFGTEVAIESKPVSRVVLLGFLVAPLAFMGYEMAGGLSFESHKAIYRSFDFADVFIFIGCAVALERLYQVRKKLYVVAGAFVLLSGAVSFPFAYDSDLLGVRHDTNGFEVDAIFWVGEHTTAERVISDERISYVSRALIGVEKDSALPSYIMRDLPLDPNYPCMLEDDWTSSGVNDFPQGLVIVPESNFTRIIEQNNVMYIGGSADNRILFFLSSAIGYYSDDDFLPW